MDKQEFTKMIHEKLISSLEALIKEYREKIRLNLLLFFLFTAAIIFMFIAYKKTSSVLSVFNAGMFFTQLIWAASSIIRSRKELRAFRKKYKELRIGDNWKPFIPDNLEN